MAVALVCGYGTAPRRARQIARPPLDRLPQLDAPCQSHMSEDPYAIHLLNAARTFHKSKPAGAHVAKTYASEEELFRVQRDVMLTEAHADLQKPLDQPASLFLNGVDLESSPGLLLKSTTEVLRGGDELAPVSYEKKQRVTLSDPEVDEPQKIAPARMKRLQESAEKRVAKKRAKDEDKAAYELMSPDEKKEERARRKAEKEARRKEKESSRGHEGAGVADEEGGDGGGGDGGGGDGGDGGGDGADEAPDGDVDDDAGPARPVRCLASRVESVVTARDVVREPRRPNSVCHASPASHDRHLTALTYFALSPAIEGAILRAEPCESVVLVDGPPGTGKTHCLLTHLEEWLARNPGKRAIVTSPTNVGAADLFRRALARGIVGALALSNEHMPADVPRLRVGELARVRTCFSTVSGRCSPRLVHHEFQGAFLDEAAHIMEAHALGLLRQSVTFLCMAGDVQQLPAVVSRETESLGGGISLLQRLVSNGMPTVSLTVQYRMHPELLRFPNKVYDDRLTTAPDRDAKPVEHPYLVVDVKGHEEAVGTSSENIAEAHACVEQAHVLSSLGLSVVILVPYQAQMRRILSLKAGFDVFTVDSFQGHEADGVVLSVTRTNSPGFWDDPRRLTVALTRAKHAARVCASVSAWKGSSGPLGDMVRDASARALVR